MNHSDNQSIKEAIASCLSGVEALPSRRGEILRAARGEKKVKRKLSKGLVLALILMLMMGSVAVAAELGLFGQIGQQEDADVRLPALDAASTPVEQVFTTPEGVTITVDQAYYDGTRVFVSYTVTGPHDQLETGTGKPDIVNYDQKLDGVIFGKQYFVDGPNGKKLMTWLDGSEPRWATHTSVNVHDGLQIGEEYLDIIGGEFYYLEDGTLMSWKECVVPAELADDEVTFSIGVFTSSSTYYQTAEALYTFGVERNDTVWYDFTVKKDQNSIPVTGSVKTDVWSATAELSASAIDVKGEVIVKGPEGWTDIWQNWENPGNLDYITDWHFYMNGVKVEGHNLNGWVGAMEEGQVSFGICYKLDALSEDMKLVPVYAQTGEHMDEAILLTAEAK